MYIIRPISAKMGVNEEGFKRLIKKLSPFIPLRLKTHAVTVVPRLAPIMTLVACESVISPELTKPTTITVVADDDWITDVTPSPVRNPDMRFPVSFESSLFRLSPALFSSAEPMTDMPNKKRQSPPRRVKKSKKSIKNRSSKFFWQISNHKALYNAAVKSKIMAALN